MMGGTCAEAPGILVKARAPWRNTSGAGKKVFLHDTDSSGAVPGDVQGGLGDVRGALGDVPGGPSGTCGVERRPERKTDGGPTGPRMKKVISDVCFAGVNFETAVLHESGEGTYDDCMRFAIILEGCK